MSSITVASTRERWARLRFCIIGHLMSAPPPAGELKAAFEALATRTWRHPVSGLDVRFGVSTLERWYYAARAAADPVAVLRNRVRGDVGRFPSLAPAVIDALTAQYRARPDWTVQLHYDNLRVAWAGREPPLPSYPTIRRYLKAQGLLRQPRRRDETAGGRRARQRREQLEVRSYEVEHVNALWHLDFHHARRKVLTRTGTWIKPLLLAVLDDRSRLVCHLQWYRDESAQSLVHGLSQALMKRGLPRALMTDNGAAMLAEETTNGLATLGILHQPTLPLSPYQNAKIEVLWARLEGRLMAMLDGEENLTFELLNQATQAWVEQEYHRSVHKELDATPLARYLAGPNVSRPCPSADALRAAFRIDLTRRPRRSDGTVALDGQRFEIPARYRHFDRVTLRYARWDLTHVDLLEPRTGTVLSPIRPLDKAANADAQRRRLAPTRVESAPTPHGRAPLLRQLLADYAATGLPPAYLPPPDAEDA